MKRCVALVALALCAFSARAAYADQCAWVPPEVAARASDTLANAAAVVSYCEPCGDAAPGTPRQVGEVSVRSVGGGFDEVAIDGQGIDLAYTYVHTADQRFENLAALAGCPATGVSPVVVVEPGSIPTGAAATTRFATPPPAAVPTYYVAPAPAPAPPATPVHVVQISAAPITPAWIIALVASSSALAAALALALVALARHRRRQSLPRALGLVDRTPK